VLNQSIPVHEGRSKKWQLIKIKFTKLINYLITMADAKKIQGTRAQKAKGSSDEIHLNLELKKVNEQADCSDSKSDLANAVIINASNVL
jgi:hypothetical protein